MKNVQKIYDKVIVGAGIAGLIDAYEILSAAKAANKPYKLVVLTDKISAPTQAGTNIVLGIDGLEEGKLPSRSAELNDLVRKGMERLQEIVRKEKIDCRMDMYYQLVAPTMKENVEGADFLVERFGYKKEEFREVKNPADRLQFKGLGEALEQNVIGQLNGPELLQGLAAAIRRMGGEIVEGVEYKGHKNNGVTTDVRTSKNTYRTSTPPLLATGPHHMSKLQDDLPVPVSPMYTMAMHVQLSPEDAKKVCSRPTGFFNPNHDYLWGSLDSKNVLTMGQGDTKNPKDAPQIEAKIRKTFHELLPQLGNKYDGKMRFSFNAMSYTPNRMPIIGRLEDFDVVTGNCGRGFVQSVAEAQAYADWCVNGNDARLHIFECLNIGQPMKPNPRYHTASKAALTR